MPSFLPRCWADGSSPSTNEGLLELHLTHISEILAGSSLLGGTKALVGDGSTPILPPPHASQARRFSKQSLGTAIRNLPGAPAVQQSRAFPHPHHSRVPLNLSQFSNGGKLLCSWLPLHLFLPRFHPHFNLTSTMNNLRSTPTPPQRPSTPNAELAAFSASSVSQARRVLVRLFRPPELFNPAPQRHLPYVHPMLLLTQPLTLLLAALPLPSPSPATTGSRNQDLPPPIPCQFTRPTPQQASRCWITVRSFGKHCHHSHDALESSPLALSPVAHQTRAEGGGGR